MHRVFVKDAIKERRIVIEDAAEIRHLVKVLRAKPGFRHEVCDSEGRVCLAEIVTVEKNLVECEVISIYGETGSKKLKIDLFQAIPKNDNMDFIVKKNTELGIDCFQPYVSTRTIVKIDEKNIRKKTERWQRIAQEAAKQSKRTEVPKVREARSLKEILPDLPNYDCVVLLNENEERRGFESLELPERSADAIALIVGPEGGFTAEEIEVLQRSGAVSLSLGPRILRTETAGIAAVSILQFLAGDMRGDGYLCP